jgi:hypothetical protein
MFLENKWTQQDKKIQKLRCGENRTMPGHYNNQAQGKKSKPDRPHIANTVIKEGKHAEQN